MEANAAAWTTDWKEVALSGMLVGVGEAEVEMARVHLGGEAWASDSPTTSTAGLACLVLGPEALEAMALAALPRHDRRWGGRASAGCRQMSAVSPHAPSSIGGPHASPGCC